MTDETQEEKEEDCCKLLLDLLKTSSNIDENIVEKIVLVQNDSSGLKLFKFAHHCLPMISRRQLHRIFERKANVVYNGRLVGREDENLRVKTGDTVEITLTARQLIVDSSEYEELKVLQENYEYCVIEKPAGMNSFVGALFGYVFPLKCWNGEYYHSCCSLFSIDKAASGLIIIGKTRNVLNKLFSLTEENRINFQMGFSCVVCSSSLSLFRSKDEAAVLQTELDTMERLSVKIISTVRTRSLGDAALIEVTVGWKIRINNDIELNLDVWGKQVSHDTKRVKNVLKRHGMAVIGHEGTGIKGKGLYLSWNKLGIGNTLYEIPVPKKLTAFLEKEEYYYHLNKTKLLEKYEMPSENRVMEIQNSEPDNEIPFEYRIGKAKFHNLEFIVNENVMIPRKSSEALVTYAVKSMKDRMVSTSEGCKSFVACLDLGTGSGCLLLSVLASLREEASTSSSLSSSYCVFGQGIDVSEEALDLAKMNAEKHNLSELTSFEKGSFEEIKCWYPKRQLDCFPDDIVFDGYDLVTCNPPYSATKERSRLSLVSKVYEPSLALFADESDSLKCYRSIVDSLMKYETLRKMDPCDLVNYGTALFNDNCLLVLEIGSGQMKRVLSMFSRLTPSWSFVSVVKDYKNVNRSLVFRYLKC
jgi:HemK-like putative methylase